MGFKQRPRLECSVPTCHRRAVAYCFECDQPCCTQHLTRVRVSILENEQGFWICPTCLKLYLDDPTLGPILRLESAPVLPFSVTHDQTALR
jgi:hypothetical protein